jgi:hypothetical protein
VCIKAKKFNQEKKKLKMDFFLKKEELFDIVIKLNRVGQP